VAWQDLERDFDAVFVGVGLGPDRLMSRLPGAGLAGVEGALAFIDRMKTGDVDVSGVRDAVVVGGGNTAVDLVRELLGLGVPRVTLVYRRDEASMKGYAHEWTQAKLAGARSFFRTTPIAFEGERRLSGVRLTRLDESLMPVQGSETGIAADRAFIAVGQARLGSLLEAAPGIRVAEGRVVVDAHGCTGRPGWYAGGDCVNGGREVVNAAAAGHTAGLAIHAFLTGADHA
jgi:glutamate synthase (NADPH/NADH) small chain